MNDLRIQDHIEQRRLTGGGMSHTIEEQDNYGSLTEGAQSKRPTANLAETASSY
jgi:hypothetical protein